MVKDLYIIGNGFDLAYGAKTSFNDFYKYYFLENGNKADKRNQDKAIRKQRKTSAIPFKKTKK